MENIKDLNKAARNYSNDMIDRLQYSSYLAFKAGAEWACRRFYYDDHFNRVYKTGYEHGLEDLRTTEYRIYRENYEEYREECRKNYEKENQG